MTELHELDRSRWRVTLFASVVAFFALLLLFQDTVHGMVYTWYNFDTYTHGFLILPLSLWLIWQRRRHLAGFTPMPTPAFLLLVAGGLVVWVLARLTGVLVVEQLAFVGIVITTLASILGWQVAKFLAFPLLFLFFSVPMGEDLVSPMMEFTATFTVEALRLSGIPVYRDGLWFSLPSGNWSVVEACSGVRYLIASVTLGVVYAYITYHTLWKRLLFIALSAIVPIFANGLRAYIIVMIGHLSKMEYATGADHLIYGWLFFGVVMFILFWMGSYWQETQEPPRYVPPPRSHRPGRQGPRTLIVLLVALAGASLAVFAADRAERAQIEMATALHAPQRAGNWRLSAATPPWSADHLPTEHQIEAVYSDGDSTMQLYVVLFPNQRQGQEAINSQNRLAADLHRSVDRGPGVLTLGDGQIAVRRMRAVITVDGAEREYLVWQWYRVAGRGLINRYEGKAWEALSRIYPGRADGAWIALATPLSDGANIDAVETRLADFATRVTPRVNDAIDRALGLIP